MLSDLQLSASPWRPRVVGGGATKIDLSCVLGRECPLSGPAILDLPAAESQLKHPLPSTAITQPSGTPSLLPSWARRLLSP